MAKRLRSLCWETSQLGALLRIIATRAGLDPRHGETVIPPNPNHTDAFRVWLDNKAAAMDLEVEAVDAPHGRLKDMIRRAGPAVYRINCQGAWYFLGVLKGRGKRVLVLTPRMETAWVAIEEVRAALCAALEAPHRGAVERMVRDAGVPAAKVERTVQQVLAQQLSDQRVAGCWVLRRPMGRQFNRLLRQNRLHMRLLYLLGAHLLQYGLVIAGWWLIGRAALTGFVDPGWLIAWVLLLFTQLPLNILSVWQMGMFSIGVGALLKKRLLTGAIRFASEELREMGVGRLLSRVYESEAIEMMALRGGFVAVLAVLELAVAALVLLGGAANWILLLLLAGWLIPVAWLGFRRHRSAQIWTDSRLEMTHDLIEKMIGHRTRLAQQPPMSRHQGEDDDLANYLHLSLRMDRAGILLTSLAPRGWLVVALLGLMPVWVAGSVSTARLAVALGGILLAQRALEKVVAGVSILSTAAIAWRRISPLFHAAANGPTAAKLSTRPLEEEELYPLLELHNVSFRYPGRERQVLSECDLEIYRGDRILMEGPSGGGKSTLAAMVTGVQEPDSGLVLFRGLDRKSMGEKAWRKHIASAPQFHENHVFGDTLLFNLLMGREWPATEEDVLQAEDICIELGLGDLLKRMPAGLLQLVGETGWQLSHGERGRLFIARALLQGADLIILDESFAALDPDNLKLAIECVLKRAPAALIIAHP